MECAGRGVTQGHRKRDRWRKDGRNRDEKCEDRRKETLIKTNTKCRREREGERESI